MRLARPLAAPVSPSMAEEPAFVATAPEDQRWKVVLLVVPMALAVLVFFGFQRRTAGSANAPVDGDPISLATPARPAEQTPLVAVPTQAEPTPVPTLTAAELFKDCETAVRARDLGPRPPNPAKKVRARDAGYPRIRRRVGDDVCYVGQTTAHRWGGRRYRTLTTSTGCGCAARRCDGPSTTAARNPANQEGKQAIARTGQRLPNGSKSILERSRPSGERLVTTA